MRPSPDRRRPLLAVLAAAGLVLAAAAAPGKETVSVSDSSPSPSANDPRNIRNGRRIPAENYCDQPYVVVTKDGNWLCTLTTGRGVEGRKGQHVVATVSADRGRTWSKLIDIEPAGGPEASWVVPLVAPSGRVYAFYTYNGDRVGTLRGRNVRADTLGWYCCRYSDDHGRTWSAERLRLPMRATACDRTNDWRGRVQMFWGICKPQVVGKDVVFAFTKLGKYMLERGEGWFYRSDNVLAERDAAKVRWELLPAGDRGLRADAFGSVQEEHNLVALRDGSLVCVYRTTKGHPCCATSRDGGRSWTKPQAMTYAPGGRVIKHPRACPKVWRTAGGKFLLWFHNHGGQSWEGRNPAWIAGGVEVDGRIHWSQPEVLLYDPEPETRMSYPDLIEQDGRFWVTETQKTVARVHEVDRALLAGLWRQGKAKTIARGGLALSLGPKGPPNGQAALPGPLDLRKTGGLSVDLWVTFRDLAVGQVLLDSRDAAGAGLALTTAKGGSIRIALSDGEASAAWSCDPGCLVPGRLHHVVATVDAGPRIITFVVDGVLCDGGPARRCGWGRYARDLGDVAGCGKLRVAPSLHGTLRRVRLYRRRLRTSEAVAHYHAGPDRR